MTLDDAALPAAYRGFLDAVGGSRWATVGGLRAHYVEAGDPAAPTILLLHGSPDNVYAWRQVLPDLAARGFRVVAPDFAGFGRSEAPDGPLTWAGEIAFLGGFIDALGLEDVVLAMTDFGSLFGAAWASAAPERVRGIALWETVTAPVASYAILEDFYPPAVGFFAVPRDPERREQYLVANGDFAAQVYGGEGLVRPLGTDELAGYDAFLATREQRDRVADIGAQMPVAGDPAETFAIAAGFARFLRTSDVPKLALYGTPGAILPAAALNAAGLPNATLASVGRGLHYLAEDAPEALVEHLATFAAGLAKP